MLGRDAVERWSWASSRVAIGLKAAGVIGLLRDWTDSWVIIFPVRPDISTTSYPSMMQVLDPNPISPLVQPNAFMDKFCVAHKNCFQGRTVARPAMRESAPRIV